MRRSSPLSPMLMSTELLMTTARPTSRRQKHKMPTVSLLVASRLLFLTAESRPPPTPLTMSTDSSLMSHTREPPSTPLSPRRDTATPPPPMLPPLLTTLKRPFSTLSRNQTSPKHSHITFKDWQGECLTSLLSGKFLLDFKIFSVHLFYYPCPVSSMLISLFSLFIYLLK